MNTDNLPIVICFLNPYSSDGLAKQYWSRIENEFSNLNITVRLIEFSGDLTEAVYSLLLNEKNKNFIITGIGGDGTHHGLINGIMRYKKEYPTTKLPIYSVIPLGTGNNLAKSLGINASKKTFFQNLPKTIKLIKEASSDCIDLGKFEDKYFIDALSFGIDAKILKGRDSDKSKLKKYPILFKLFKGYPIYLFNVIKSLFSNNRIQAEIFVDNELYYNGKIFNLIINNCAIYAGEFDLTPNSKLDDGLLDLIIFKNSFSYLLAYVFNYRHLPKIISNTINSLNKSAIRTKGKSFNIKCSKTTIVQLDGELLSTPKQHLKIKSIPKGINIILKKALAKQKSI